MLVYATEKHHLEDKSKALRCILYFTVKDGDWDETFDKVKRNKRVYFSKERNIFIYKGF